MTRRCFGRFIGWWLLLLNARRPSGPPLQSNCDLRKNLTFGKNRLMKKRYFFLAAILVLLGWLLFWPVPIDPVAWTPPPNPGLSGPYAPNTYLDEVEYRYAGQCAQCEDVAIDSLGRIYGGTSAGQIIRFDRGRREVFAETGGRQLGLDFDRHGNLLVADAERGLLAIDSTGKVAVLSAQEGGRPFKFTDDLEIGPDGTVYFSDASSKFGVADYKLDLMEHRPNGRLLAYDPANGQTRLLLDSLYFANGIAVDPDGQFVLVTETGAYRVRRYWLAGPRQGQNDVLIDNLPGFPDGISRGSDGIFWMPIISRRNALLEWLMPRPWARKIVIRLPAFLQPAPERYSFVLGIDAQGEVVYNLQGPSGKFAQISSVQEYGGKLFLGSLGEDGIGVAERP
jgi:sugar lactone lactonase YvrE